MKALPWLVYFLSGVIPISGQMSFTFGKDWKKPNGSPPPAAKDWDSFCPFSCLPDPYKDRVFHLYSNKKTGLDARDFCHSLGGRLAHLDDNGVGDKLKNQYHVYSKDQNTQYGFWIGGKSLPRSPNHIYDDFTAVPATKDYEPKDLSSFRRDGEFNCLAISKETKLISVFSDKASRGVMCEFLNSDASKQCPDKCDNRDWDDYHDGIKYFGAMNRKNYAEAYSHCRLQGVNLFTYNDNDKNKLYTLRAPAADNYFIGGGLDPKCNTLQFQNAMPHVTPNEMISCTEPMRYICQDKTTSSHQNIVDFGGVISKIDSYYGYPRNCVQYLGSCFLFVKESKNRGEAHNYCSGLGASNLNDDDNYALGYTFVVSFLWLTISTNTDLKNNFGYFENTYLKISSGFNGTTMIQPIKDPDFVGPFICEFVLCERRPDKDDTLHIKLVDSWSKQMDGYPLYECQDNFKALTEKNQAVATCRHGNWEMPNMNTLFCSPCSDPPPQMDASLHLTQYKKQPWDGVFTYQCQPGYTSLDNDFNAVCNENKNWDTSGAHKINCTENVAFKKNALQSSNWIDEWGASKAVDGDQNTFQETQHDPRYPWWRVDLGAEYAVSDVVIYHRPNYEQRFHDVTIHVSDEDINQTAPETIFKPNEDSICVENIGHDKSVAPGKAVYHCKRELNGRFVTVQMTDNCKKGRNDCNYGFDNIPTVQGIHMMEVQVIGNLVEETCPRTPPPYNDTLDIQLAKVLSKKGSYFYECAEGYATMGSDMAEAICQKGEWEIPGPEELNCTKNVAFQKPAMQSKEKTNIPTAPWGVDGNRSTFQDTGRDQFAWWRVDLKDSYTVYAVIIYHRENLESRFHDVVIRVSNEDIKQTKRNTVFMPNDDSVCVEGIGESASIPPGKAVYTCDTPVTGRFVSVQIIKDCTKGRKDCNIASDRNRETLHVVHMMEVQVIGWLHETDAGCMDDPVLSSDRTDVKLVNITRNRVSTAFFECSQPNTLFPWMKLGDVFPVHCSEDSQPSFSWNVSSIPNCLKMLDDTQCNLTEPSMSIRVYKRKHTGMEAREYCHRMGGRLVSIKSKDKVGSIASWLKTFEYSDFWIGGSNIYGTGEELFLEDGSKFFTSWKPAGNNSLPKNTCLILKSGETQPRIRACNDKNQTASILCEFSGPYFCPILILNNQDGNRRVEYYNPQVMRNKDESWDYCEEIGGVWNLPGHDAVLKQLSQIKSLGGNDTFLSDIRDHYNFNGTCDADVTSSDKPLTTVWCNDTQAATSCVFDDYGLEQGTAMGGIYRVLSDDEELKYPEGCIQFHGGCFLFVHEPNKSRDDAIQSCKDKGGDALDVKDKWKLAFLQLTFVRLDDLADTKEVISPLQDDKLCLELRRHDWNVHFIPTNKCRPTPVFICEFWWCLDEPKLNRSDVTQVSFVRKSSSVAVYNCSSSTAKFEGKESGQTDSLQCGPSGFKWDEDKLKECIEGLVTTSSSGKRVNLAALPSSTIFHELPFFNKRSDFVRNKNHGS